MARAAAALLAATTLAAGLAHAQAPERRNWFDDPFFQLTSQFPGCPMPRGPMLTQEEQRLEAHDRIERGTSCWLAGRCADSNYYRADKAIGERVRAALAALPGLDGSSVWMMVQRHWVFLQGCVARPEQAALLERTAKSVGGVELVVPQLDVGIGRPPRYRTLQP